MSTNDLQVVWTKPWLAEDFEGAGISVTRHSTLDPVEQVGPIWWTTEAATWSKKAGFKTNLVAPNYEDFLNLKNEDLIQRNVSWGTVRDYIEFEITDPWFIKPADSKIIIEDSPNVGKPMVDEPVYWASEAHMAGVPYETMLLLSEPVTFTQEWRCWFDGYYIQDMAMYRSGNETWDSDWPRDYDIRAALHAAEIGKVVDMPCVIDVGYTEEYGLELVELNPVWSSGLYSADPAQVYECLKASYEYSLAGKGREWEPDAWLASKSRLW